MCCITNQGPLSDNGGSYPFLQGFQSTSTYIFSLDNNEHNSSTESIDETGTGNVADVTFMGFHTRQKLAGRSQGC